MTRGAITTFSIANDVAKYFAILPAMFMAENPKLQALNVMQLHSPETAILSTLIFNAIIIPALIPLSLRGVKFKPEPPQKTFLRNMLIYGVGGASLPFVGIKAIDMLLSVFIGCRDKDEKILNNLISKSLRSIDTDELKDIISENIRPSIKIVILMIIATGIAYPLLLVTDW